MKHRNMRSNHELALALGVSERTWYRFMIEKNPDALQLLKFEHFTAGGLADSLTRSIAELEAHSNTVAKFDEPYSQYIRRFAENLRAWMKIDDAAYRKFRFEYRKANGLLDKPLFLPGMSDQEKREQVEWSEYMQGGPRPQWDIEDEQNHPERYR
jgi:hypothetical protein